MINLNDRKECLKRRTEEATCGSAWNQNNAPHPESIILLCTNLVNILVNSDDQPAVHTLPSA